MAADEWRMNDKIKREDPEMWLGMARILPLLDGRSFGSASGQDHIVRLNINKPVPISCCSIDALYTVLKFVSRSINVSELPLSTKSHYLCITLF